MKNMRKRNKYIDAAKALACIFVVLIHCMFPGKIGLVFRALARFAVPLFFAVSGYFLGGIEDKGKINASILRKIKRLLWIILISGVGYFILELAENAFLAGDAFNLINYLESMISWEIILRFFVTNTPIVYMPRWFLWALIYCYIFVFILNKRNINYKWLYRGCGILLVINLILECMVALNGIDPGLEIGNSGVYIRIRLLFFLRALPWFGLGLWAKEFGDKLLRIDIKIYWIMCIAGGITTIIQALLMGDAQIYLGTILMVISIFGIANKKETERCNGVITHIGEKLSLYVYILHGAVISAISLLERLLFRGNENELFMWIKPLLVILISLIGAEVIHLLVVRINNKRKE